MRYSIFLLFSSSLAALPSTPEVKSGQAACVKGPHALEITASDKAILHFDSFGIGSGEEVRFVMPSNRSTVLSRVTGAHASDIYGSLQANGRLLLVNPNGIYFGPNAKVDVHSLIASTLQINNDDFLADKYCFAGSGFGSVINEGIIKAEEFAVLLGSRVINKGKILADVGKVFLGAGEKIVLDFTGNGLIHFAVEGDIAAQIENCGEIRSAELTMRAVRKVIETVVNTDGIEPAAALIRQDGEVRLLSASEIQAEKVLIEGQIEASGKIKGQTVHLLGDQITLKEAHIDASGECGGEVLIGGAYQGKGPQRNAQSTIVDADSIIYADAKGNGKGGTVIIWSDGTTLFDGKVFARGGLLGGDGGFVETSGKEDLGIASGFVDTSAPMGRFGDWLLDPSSIVIATGGPASIAQCSAPNCANVNNRTIAPATIAASATNVALCAQATATSSITVTNSVTMNNAGVSLSLTAGSGNAGPIALNANLTTRGGALTLTGTVAVGAAVTLDTTNAGGTAAGANITFSNTVNGANSLTLRAGTGGVIAFNGAVGGSTPLTNLAFTSASQIRIGSNITVSGANPLSFPSPVLLTGASTITSNNANVTFSSTLNGAQTLSIAGGSGTTAFSQAIGATAALTSLSATAAIVTQSSTAATTGALSYSGSTAINLGGNITTSGGLATFTGPASLTAGVAVDTTNAGGVPAGANITFSSTINGNQNLNFRSGLGNILVSGAIGGSAQLNAITVVSAANVTTGAISAASLTQSAGTGVTTFNGALNLSGASGLSLTTNNVAFNGNLQTAAGGGAAINVGGTLTISSGVIFTLDGPFTQSGAGGVQCAGTITTTNDAIQFAGPVVLTGTTVLNTGSANILFSSTIEGPGSLTMTAGAGNITFTGSAGSSSRLGAITVNSVQNWSLGSVSAVSILQAAGSGTTSSTGTINTSGASGIQLTGTNFSRSGTITTTGGGSFTITNSGTMAAAAFSDMLIDGAFTQNGAGSVVAGGTLRTNNGNISFSGPVTLGAATLFDSGSGNGNITLSSTVDGGQTFTLYAGIGDILFSGQVGNGAPISDITINTVGNLTFQNTVNASSLSQLSGTGTTTLNGAVATTGSTGVSLIGTAFSLNGNITTTTLTTGASVTLQNSGTASLAAGTAWNLAGAFAQTGTGGVTLARSITAGDTISFVGPVTVSGTPALSTAAASKDITFYNTVDGSGSLTLSAGGADILFEAAVGSTIGLGALAVSTVRNFTLQAATAASIAQSAGTGSTLFNGDLNTTAIAGIQIATSGAVTFVGNAAATASGVLTVTNGGLLTTSAGKLLSTSGAFTQNGAGAVSLAGSITTAGAALSFASPITLTAPAALSTGPGAGNISFGTIDGAQPLTLTAGTGSITASGNLGGTNRLGTILVNSAADISVQNITCASITVSSATGTMSLVGDLNTNAPAGIQLTGNNFSRTGSIVTTNDGPLIINNSGLLSDTIINTTSIEGGYFQIGSGAVDLAGTITTVDSEISFAGPITLVGGTVLDTGTDAGPITISNTLDGNQTLDLSTGVGDITFSQAVGGGIPLGALTINSANDLTFSSTVAAASISGSTIAGLVTANGAISTSGASGISLSAYQYAINAGITTTGTGPLALDLTGSAPLTVANGVLFSLDGAFSQTGSGSVSMGGSIAAANAPINFASPVNLTANVALNTGAGAGDITFLGAVNGAHTLTLTAGTGSLPFNFSIGLINPLTALTIASGTNITTARPIQIAGPFNSSVSGTTTFNSTVTTTTAAGMNLSGAAFNLNGSLSTTNGGPIAITNSGVLAISAPLTSSSSFTQTGAGAVSLGTNLTTTGALSIASPVTLLNHTFLTTNNGPLTLSDTVQGTFDFTLTAGSGNITLGGAAGGGINPLADLRIVSAHNTTTQAITSGKIEQETGTGLTHFQGALSTSLINGINLIGAQFQFDQSVSTINGGSVAIVQTGGLTLPSTSSFTLDGTFTESGGGAVSLGANITTSNDTISWADPITLTHDTALDTGAGAGDITFASAIDGGFCLTLTAGTGNVVFNGALGGTSLLSCLNAAGAQIAQNSTVATTGTVAETGTILLSGGIATSNSDITLTGNVTAKNNLILSTGSGIGNITVAGTINGDVSGRNLTFSAGTGSISVSGTIGGLVPLNNLNFSGNAITWANLGTAGLAGAIGTATATAADTIHFTGTNYNGGSQIYTAANDFSFEAGAATTLISNTLPITFTTGLINLAASTDFNVSTNGGNISFVDLAGPGLNINLDAYTGSVNFNIIGSTGNVLNVTITSTSHSGTINSTNPPNFFSPTTLSFGTDQIGPAIYNSPVLITADNLTFSGGGFTFNSTLNSDGGGPRNLTINPGLGNSLTLNGLVGNSAPLTSLAIGAADSITASSNVAVGSLVQTGGTGTTTFSGGITTTAASGINLATNAISLSGSVNTTGGGSVTLNNSGTLTLASADFGLDGIFQQTGSGGVSIGGSIQTTDDPISFAGAVTLTSPLSLNAFSSTGANISFASTVSGGQDLVLTAGSGVVTFTGAVGAVRLGRLAINSAGSVAAAAISAASLVQSSGSGIYNGTIDTNTSNGIQVTGSSFSFADSITTTGSGPFSIANSGTLSLAAGKTYSAGGAFTQSGSGSNSIAGTIAAGSGISFAAPIALSGTTLLDTSANQTDITLSGTIDGANDLTFNLGNLGSLIIGGNVGSTTRLGAFTITNVENAATQAIRAAAITQTGGQVLSSFGSLDATGNISLTGTQIAISGDLISSAGVATINNSNTLTLAAGSNSLVANGFTQSGAGNVTLSGTLTTANSAISFTGAATLNGATVLSTGPGLGDITFSNILNGAQTLNLAAGTGNILFGGNIGTSIRLGALTIASATNVTYANISATSINQTATGTTALGGTANTNGAAGIVIVSGAVNQTGTLTTTNGGPTSITNSSTFTKAAAINSDGGFSQNGSGGVSLTGSITTTNDTISFAGPISLAGTTTLSTGGSGAGNISFSNTIDQAQNLNLTAGLGSITFGAAIGGGVRIGTLTIDSAQNLSAQAITAAAVSQLSGTGTSTFAGALNTNGASGISLIGSAFTLSANVTTTGGGSLTIQNSALLTLSGPAFSIAGSFAQTGTGNTALSGSITASGGISFLSATTLSAAPVLTTANQPISFANTVNGSGGLTLASGSGSITFSGNVGNTASLGALFITNTGSFTAQSVSASSISQSTGAALFNGDITTTGNVSLTTTTLSLAGNLTSGGATTLTNSGILTTAAGKSLSSVGSFIQNGSGAVSLAGTVSTANANLSFASAITLIAPAALSTGSGAGNITLNGTVDGGESLAFTAGTGDITFNSALGGATRLGNVLINSTHDLNSKSLTAASIQMLASSGTLSLVGDFNTNTPTGIQLAGTNFFRNGSLITTNSGPFIVTNSGTITGVSTNTTSISGPYIQNGTGPVNLAGTITTANNLISFSSAITLADNATLDSGTGSAEIILSGAVNGSKNLTLSSGVGNITLSSALGNSTPLGIFQVTACNNFSSKSISADSISIANLLAAATLNGDLTTSGASGISLSGGAFNCTGNVACGSTGGLTLTNSLPSSFSSSKSISLGGAFLQNGSASLSMGGTLSTNNQNITFQGPLNLSGNLTLNSGSGAGNITIGPELDGTFNLIAAAGTGDFTCNAIVGDHAPLNNFTVSANNVVLAAIGTSSAAGASAVNLTAANLIALNGFYYNANTQTYTSGSDLDCQTGTRVTLISNGPITCNDSIHLNSGTDLYIQTNGGNFAYSSLRGTNFENFVVETGSGAAHLGTIGASLEINNVTVTAGSIILEGPIEALTVTMTSSDSILNASSPVDIQSQNTATFNALGGNDGSRSSPLLVHTSGQIFAGGIELADFNGSSIDNTVNPIPGNVPCVIIFNGVTIRDCNAGPSPSFVPPIKGFPAPGLEDSMFNLASDYYFLPDFLDRRYFVPVPHSLLLQSAAR